jgi:hypothetical protein
MKRFPLYTLLLVLLFAGSAMAAEVRDLYEAEVPVADQQGDARQEAMRAGLAEVLVRVTGYIAVAQDPALADLLDNASRYVQQYRYRALTPAPVTDPAAPPPPTLALWMSFDANTINQALRSRSQPVWGSARPLLLVWLAVESGSERRLVAAAESASHQALELTARRRGVPLRLPLLDLEDQARVTAADVWGGFAEPVMAASARYQPQAVLIGRLYHDRQGGWHGRWTLRVGDEAMNWDSGGTTPDAVLALGVEGSADALAMRFSQIVDPERGSVLSLRVDDVRTLADYARLLSYLDALSGVTAVQVAEVEPQTVTCRLTLEMGAGAVARTIGLGSTLAAVAGSAPLPPGELPLELHYRLLP